MAQRGILICLIGIDGSGKTTQAELLVDWLQSSGVKSIYIWSRGGISQVNSILLFVARRIFGTSKARIASGKKLYSRYQSTKSKLLQLTIIRVPWSIMIYLGHLIQINLDIRRKLSDGFMVVSDRYLWDSNIDLAVINNKKEEWLSGRLNNFMWMFVPKPKITFFINIPPEEALRRKNDIPSFSYVSRRAELYRYLAQCNDITEINGCGDVAVIQNIIINTLRSYLEGSGKR